MSRNSFGEVFRFSTWGESHGSAIGCMVDGVPPRLPVSEQDIRAVRLAAEREDLASADLPHTLRFAAGVLDRSSDKLVSHAAPCGF